jgi:hypothetical protein
MTVGYTLDSGVTVFEILESMAHGRRRLLKTLATV